MIQFEKKIVKSREIARIVTHYIYFQKESRKAQLTACTVAFNSVQFRVTD